MPAPADVCCRVPSSHSSSDEAQQWRRLQEDLGDDNLPRDPRTWSRSDVALWLIHTAATHKLSVQTPRFPMNGKALCLMTPDMYTHRVPLGGKLLYRDFQIRLARAMNNVLNKC